MMLPLIDGKTLEEAKRSVREKLWPTMCANWKIWPLVMFVNFQYIPLKF